jgi:hypothetical protein
MVRCALFIMANPYRMNAGLQGYNLNRMVSNTRWGDIDIHAHMDRSLRLDENMKNIRKQFGIQTRQPGLELIEQRKHEQHREQIRRANPDRQTGRIQSAHNIQIDAMLTAMRPGKRFSNTGHRYYEYRANRSDINPSKRL